MPKTIQKAVFEVIEATLAEEKTITKGKLGKAEKEKLIKELTAKMKEAAKMLEFELAAQLRDEIIRLSESEE